MSNIRAKQKIISMLSPEPNNFVEQMFDNGRCEYSDLVTANAHNTGAISFSDLETILGQAYKAWYTRSTKLKPKTDIQRALQATLLEESQYQPNHIALGDGFLHFFTERFAYEFPMSDCPVNIDNNITNGFHHIMGNYNLTTECRFYLNLQSKNVVDFVTHFITLCEKKGLPYYLEFCLPDNRNDRLSIGTDYEHALDTLKVLKHIKTAHPYIFDKADKINPMLAKIDKYIGFGEEPVSANVTFNKSRVDAIAEFIHSSSITILKEVFKKPYLNNPRFSESVGLDDYICNYITSELRSLANPLDVDIDSPINQEIIKAYLPTIYSYIIAGNKEEYQLSFQSKESCEKIVTCNFTLPDKLMSVFRISNRLSNNARLTALLENIYTSHLSKHIVTSAQGVSLPFDKFIIDIFRVRAIEQLQQASNNATPDKSYNAKIALHEIKCNTELGRLAILRALATYIERCNEFADPYVELDLSPVSMEKFGLGNGFTDIVLTHCPKDKDHLSALLHDHTAKSYAYSQHDVSADFPFLNANTVKELSTLNKHFS